MLPGDVCLGSSEALIDSKDYRQQGTKAGSQKVIEAHNHPRGRFRRLWQGKSAPRELGLGTKIEPVFLRAEEG